MRWIYPSLLRLASPLLRFSLWLSGEQGQARLKAAFPLLPPDPKRLWVQAASTGEAFLAIRLIKELTPRLPGWSFLLTSNRPEALELAQEQLDCPVSLAPLDLPGQLDSFFAACKPAHLLLIETEVWPNLIGRIKDQGGKVLVANGRLSNHSIQAYQRTKWIFAPAFAQLDLVLAGDRLSLERFAQLGTAQAALHFAGNLKFEVPLEADPKLCQSLKDQYQLQGPLAVAGSVQPEEMIPLLLGYQAALEQHPDLELLVVPRHLHKKAEFDQAIRQVGFVPLFASDQAAQARPKLGQEVRVIDQMGLLRCFYQLADLVFVGGSLLSNRGGQNMVEAVALGKPVAVGPQTQNFKDAVQILSQARALTIIKDEQDWQAFVELCLNQPQEMKQRAQAGRQLVLEHQGALEFHLQQITQFLAP